MLVRELGCHSYFGYLRVDDVDGYYAEAVGRGVETTSEVGWLSRGACGSLGCGRREGIRIMIGQIIDVARPG